MNSGITVIILCALLVFGGLAHAWITTRNRPRPAEPDSLGQERKVELLTAENERLNGQVGRLEERIAVLERIATDPAERTAREIEQLRQNS